MAKHDRRKPSSQPPSSRTVTIQVPLPVLGVLNGVREAFHGLCIKTGMQVLECSQLRLRHGRSPPTPRNRPVSARSIPPYGKSLTFLSCTPIPSKEAGRARRNQKKSRTPRWCPAPVEAYPNVSPG